jgi:hypothetical protein
MDIKTQCEALVIGLAMMVATMITVDVHPDDKIALIGVSLVLWLLMTVKRVSVLSLASIRLVDDRKKLGELRSMLFIAGLVIVLLGMAAA